LGARVLRVLRAARSILTDNNTPLLLLDKQILEARISPRYCFWLRLIGRNRHRRILDSMTIISTEKGDRYWWNLYARGIPQTKKDTTELLNSLGFNPAILELMTSHDYEESRSRWTAPIYMAIHEPSLSTCRQLPIVTRNFKTKRLEFLDAVYVAESSKTFHTPLSQLGVWWPRLQTCNYLQPSERSRCQLSKSVQELGFNPEIVDLAFKTEIGE